MQDILPLGIFKPTPDMLLENKLGNEGTGLDNGPGAFIANAFDLLKSQGSWIPEGCQTNNPETNHLKK